MGLFKKTIEITVPTSLDEISLAQYQKLMNLIKENEGESAFVSQKTIEIICGIKLNEVAKMSLTSVQEVTSHIAKLFECENKLIKSFEINGTTFGFIPVFEDISFGEYVDLESYLKDVSTYHKALAVMYRPIVNVKGERYTIEEYEGSDKYCELMKGAPLSVMLGCIGFFLTLQKELLNALTGYLGEEMESLTDSLNSGTNGDGINHYISYLKEMSHDLTTLLN